MGKVMEKVMENHGKFCNLKSMTLWKGTRGLPADI